MKLRHYQLTFKGTVSALIYGAAPLRPPAPRAAPLPAAPSRFARDRPRGGGDTAPLARALKTVHGRGDVFEAVIRGGVCEAVNLLLQKGELERVPVLQTPSQCSG